MASIYNGLIYNDDVDMAAEDNAISPSSIFEAIENISHYAPIEPPEPTVPEVIDIDPSDTITRVIDGWTPDLTPTGGTPGETYNDTPPTAKPENPAQRTKTIYSQTQIIISDYSASYLNQLEAAGATFYVVYTDGTRDQVTKAEVVDPKPPMQTTIQVETEAIARAINQYFWHDTNGVHVTDVTQSDWADAVDDNFSDWPATPYHNILMNSLGLLLRTQLINLASLSRSGIAFFDGTGNNANNILASFGLNGSLLRAGGRDVMRITPTGVVFVPLEGNEVSVTMITDNIANLTNAVQTNKEATDQDIANLQAQIDGVVDTYYEEVDPEYDIVLTDSSSNNVVSSGNANIEGTVRTPWMYGWYTEEQKSSHEGDLYYNIDTGHAWRWLKVDNVWQWYRIADSDVAEALQIARNANTLAGTKKRVFTSTPTVPYDIGDLWVDGSKTRYATVARATGSTYSASDWTVTSTDDTLATTALNKANEVAGDLLTLSGDVTIIQQNYVNTATYEQNNKTWAASLSTQEESLKTYTDGAISAEVTNRDAAITAESKAIKLVVSNTYQVKGDYATQTDLANEVKARTSAISQSAGNILQQVSETYATNETLGTYVNQTSQDITTIIGDQNSIKSVVYQHANILDDIVTETDGKNSIYYGSSDPVIDDTLTDSSNSSVLGSSSQDISAYRYTTNNPIYKWNSADVRAKHVDDTFINTTNAHVWRYTSSYTWEYVENTDATNAGRTASDAAYAADQAAEAARLASQSATNAMTEAGKKKRVFTTTPTPPYDVGDLWVDGSKTRYSSVARSTGSYNASDWHVTSTDDSSLDTYKNTVATIIRETSAGVLVAKAGAAIGTLQAASNFKVVGINSWSGSTPTIGATYALFGANGLSVYDNTGTKEITFIGVQNSLSFARLGEAAKGNVQIGVNSSGNGYIDFYNGSTLLGHIGYDSGTNADGGVSTAPYQTFGVRKSGSTIGNYSFIEGYNNTASGYCSHAEGRETTASGYSSHAEGYLTKAIGAYSHAEGYFSEASGGYSHAEGNSTASGYCSHAEGYETTASGNYSHAEGHNATASGDYSHAEGSHTEADKPYMHAGGYYNRIGISNCYFAIGNGTSSSNRKNAFTVLSTGAAYINGTTSSNGTAVTSDARIKTLISNLSTKDSIDFINKLQPKHYYKEGVEEIGFYAQDIEQLGYFGNLLVTKDNSGLYDLPDFRVLNYQGLIAPIVSALQNALKRIDELEKLV